MGLLEDLRMPGWDHPGLSRGVPLINRQDPGIVIGKKDRGFWLGSPLVSGDYRDSQGTPRRPENYLKGGSWQEICQPCWSKIKRRNKGGIGAR